MAALTSPFDWSKRFGLALSPMFEREDVVQPGDHHVLLNGGYGSFGLSVTNESLSLDDIAAWAWSSDLPHHVAVDSSTVSVVRWDAIDEAEAYTINHVLGNLDAFYEFLCKDRLRSNRNVVRHLVNLFGRIRTLAAHSGLSDDRSIDAFVVVLGRMLSGENASLDPTEFGLPDDAMTLLAQLDSDTLHNAIEEFSTAPVAIQGLSLYPSLAIRHAGGQIFQEAHFDLVRAPPPDMFGHIDPAVAARNTRGGIHFTPPALARSIVDFTLSQFEDLGARPSLRICDPACGSGAFLHELLRGLRRVGYDGSLHITGYDISAPAVAMARFTLSVALRDWRPKSGVKLTLNVQDSLELDNLPHSDIIVMNPPFVSSIAQTQKQKSQLRNIVGSEPGSRGDYSMAFITKALKHLTNGGVLGTLFPANLLTHKSTMHWRYSLASNGEVRLLARIGDFGLFSQAMVHVACLVVQNSPAGQSDFTALVTDNVQHTTVNALRELRKASGRPPMVPRIDSQWKLFAVPPSALKSRSWRILTPQQRELLDALAVAQTPTVGALFDISQGVQTGARKVFILDGAQINQLPRKERKFFRKVLMTDSIRNGKIVRVYYLFFPHNERGPLFQNEEDLAKAAQVFYNSVLKPNEHQLRQRASIVRSKRPDWWGLMRPRATSFESLPRIISKFFGTEGSFVFDGNAEYLPSTAHMWMPKFGGELREEMESVDEAILKDVLRAYTALFNSRAFIRLVSFSSVIIAGGQYDLSKRFISDIYIPDLWDGVSQATQSENVKFLWQATEQIEGGEHVSMEDIDQRVAQLYGVPELAEE